MTLTLFPFLIAYYVILAVFVIFNLFALRYIYRLKYLGPGVVGTVLIIYLIIIGFIVVVSHMFILQIDWNQTLFRI